MTDLSRWDYWHSCKQVWAARIIELRGDHVIVALPDGTGEAFTPTEPAMLKHAELGGVAVIYPPDAKFPEGYRSISPHRAFAEGYELIRAGVSDAAAG